MKEKDFNSICWKTNELAASGARYSDKSECYIRYMGDYEDKFIPVMRGSFDFTNGLCSVKAKMSTTGFRGGDSGHGGRTWIELDFDELFDLGPVKFTENSKTGHKKLSIYIRGDEELSQITDLLHTLSEMLLIHKDSNNIRDRILLGR